MWKAPNHPAADRQVCEHHSNVTRHVERTESACTWQQSTGHCPPTLLCTATWFHTTKAQRTPDHQTTVLGCERECARPLDGLYKSAPAVSPAGLAPLLAAEVWGSGAQSCCVCSDRPRLDGTMADQAFVTLTTNDAYAKGALVLGSSLKQDRTTRRLVVLATPQVSDTMRKVLEKVFDEVIMVDVLDSGDSAHLTLMKRPELGVTLKLHCWSLTQYSKCVFMDADTLVLANIDDLFEREELSAAPDPGPQLKCTAGCFTTNVLRLLQHYGLVKDTCSYRDVEHASGAISPLALGENPAAPQPSVSSEDRKERWEQGQADYMGAHSFDNIK
ncbi:Glycogenin-1 [Heterocephalus glaber]|uniref:Glycogenin-1 n=1 Tax=Heterocephalus glaber TaxID=10181 RepID=G5AW50_HETGA|nr:Glycogenin-1 [Heterocephalus glaber]